jgi:leader peptidase (prepilin peptidase)/N-methyltransferase
MIDIGLAALAGLVLGSLLNVIIIRLPREERVLGWPRCTRTGERLAWWQLLPLLGWLLQRGRASDGRPLHWIYPLVEVLTALAVGVLYATYGLTPTFFYLVFVCAVLIVTGAVDWLYRWIYTFFILGSVPVALLASLAIPQVTLLNSGLGILVAAIVFIFLYMLARVLFPGKAAPFGLGDVYLGIFLGAALGFSRLGPSLVYGIFMAGAVSAVIVFAKYALRRSDVPEYISYGSYLCLGAVLYILWGM